MKIGDEKDEVAPFLSHLSGFAEVSHGIVNVFKHGPGSDRIVGGLAHRYILEFLRVDGNIVERRSILGDFHACYVPSARMHESEEIAVTASDVQQSSRAALLLDSPEVTRLRHGPSGQVVAQARGRRSRIIICGIVFGHFREGGARIDETQAAIIALHDGESLVGEESRVGYFVHGCALCGTTQIAGDVFQTFPLSCELLVSRACAGGDLAGYCCSEACTFFAYSFALAIAAS